MSDHHDRLAVGLGHDLGMATAALVVAWLDVGWRGLLVCAVVGVVYDVARWIRADRRTP